MQVLTELGQKNSNSGSGELSTQYMTSNTTNTTFRSSLNTKKKSWNQHNVVNQPNYNIK